MWNYLAVAVGGVIGCCTRYGLTQLVQQFYGRSFPLATFVINILGCFLMGWLFFLTLERLSLNPTLRTAVLTGGLGGFTTFSTFAMEALLLVEEGATRIAVVYVAASVLLGLAAAFAGAWLARGP